MHIPETIKTYGLIIIIIASSFWFASRFIDPPPPSEITLAAGPKTGEYYKYAMSYKNALAEEGVDVNIIETKGSVENILLLEDGKADAAFIQSGLASKTNTDQIVGLAGLYYEALWVFTKEELSAVGDVHNLKGKKIAVGVEGSGTNAIARQILGMNGLDKETTLVGLSGQEAVKALEEGQVDAAFFVAQPTSDNIQQLLKQPDIHLLSFSRASGYTKLLPFLSKVELAEGVFDMTKNVPDRSISLISPIAQLASRSDFSKALRTLLVRTAFEVHTEGGLFAEAGQFPTLQYVDFPIAEEAERHFEYGPNILQRVLPFWIADMINRMVVLLIPFLGVMLPLLKIASPTYKWRTRSKIYKWYKNLKKMEDEDMSKPEKVQDIMTALEHIEQEVKKTQVPLSYTDELYNLRLHIQMIRETIKKTN